MIIGISGYMGSGKDTVAKIIKELDGSWVSRDDMGAGQVWRSKHSWVVKKFAGKLKEIASMLTGIPVEKFEDQEFKSTFLGDEWNYMHSHAVDMQDEEFKMTVREFLQRLGTDAVRDGLHKNAWVNALMSDYKWQKKEGGYQRSVKSSEGIPTHMEYEVEGVENWLITDVRFPNEAQAVKDNGGFLIRINRFQKSHKSVGLHPSETSLDKWDFDETIENNGTLEELTEKVKWIMESRNLL